MLKYILLIACLGAFQCQAELLFGTHIKDLGTHVEVCDQEPIELGIVLDSSRSIKEDDFNKTKWFLRGFLDYFDIGDGYNDVRVCLIPFGKGIYPQHSFDLDTYTDKEALLDAVLNIPHMQGGRTDTGDAIEYMHTVQMIPAVTRSWASKIVVVITDGNSQLPTRTNYTAVDTRADNITVFALGIGNVLKTELLNIGGDDNHVALVKNFDSLDSVKGVLASKTCIRKEKSTTTTTTPMPQTTCGEDEPSDVNFVFSPADMGLDATSWTTSFISHVVGADEMDIGFQYGVISGNCPDDAGFALNRYNNATHIRERLLEYDRLKIPNLTRRTATYGYSAANGGRAGVRQVAVVFASGGKKAYDLYREIDALVEQGILVYVATPQGGGFDVPDGAYELQGESSRYQAEDFISRLCPEL